MNNKLTEQRWTAYLNAYDATDEAERQRLLESSVAEDVTFTNPAAEGKSRHELNTHIESFRKSNPGAHFGTDKLYHQPGRFLAVWSMYKKDGAKVATGYNFVDLDDQGRFGFMAGFF